MLQKLQHVLCCYLYYFNTHVLLYIYVPDVPVLIPPLLLQLNTGRVNLSWWLPKGFYTSLGVEECVKEYNQCRIHPLHKNATSIDLEYRESTYRLVVYQDGQQVAVSEPFVEKFPLHGNTNECLCICGCSSMIAALTIL